MTTPTYADAVARIAEAKALGGRIMCGMQCGREATVLMTCSNGTLQGVGCQPCIDKHFEMIEAAMVFQASGMAEPMCSRCGDDSPGADHIVTEPI